MRKYSEEWGCKLFVCNKICVDIISGKNVAFVYTRIVDNEPVNIIVSKDQILKHKLEGYEYIDFIDVELCPVLFYKGKICTKIPSERLPDYIDVPYDKLNDDIIIIYGYIVNVYDLMEIDSEYSLETLSRLHE